MAFDNNNQLVFERFQKSILNNPKSWHGSCYGDTPIIRPKDEALKYRLIQCNGPKFVRYLTFDLDHDDPDCVANDYAPGANNLFAWQNANVPRPTLIMQNPRNGHCHYVYELTFSHDRANRKAVWKADTTIRALRDALGADLSYQGIYVKNPFHPDWTVIAYDKTYTFEELTEHIDVSPVAQRNRRKAVWERIADLNGHSRELSLNEWLKFYARSEVRNHTSKPSFYDAVYAEGLTHNQSEFSSWSNGILPAARVRAWTRNIVNWVWEHRHLFAKGDPYYRVRQSVLPLPPDMPLREKQQHGQAYTTDQRNLSTRDKILSAIQQLQSAGHEVTKSAVARISQLGRSTVIRQWNSISIPAVSDLVGGVSLGVLYDPTPCTAGAATNDSARRASVSPSVTVSVTGTTDEKQTERVIRDINDTPWQCPFVMWHEPINDNGDVIKEPPKPRYDRHNPPPAIASLIPATGITTSMDLLSYRQVVDIGQMSVKAFLYADFMAVAYGILIPDLPENTKARLTRLINTQDHSHERYG